MQKQRDTNYQKNIGSATLFALALLILSFSCPMKRLLTNNYPSQTSKLTHAKPTLSTNNLSVFYSDYTSCEAGVDKVAILQASKSYPENAGTSVFTSNISTQSGYYIHSFLDGIKTVYGIAPASDYSSLPLFLQHRRLLI